MQDEPTTLEQTDQPPAQTGTTTANGVAAPEPEMQPLRELVRRLVERVVVRD